MRITPIKAAVCNIILKPIPRIVIASSGRQGSTMLFHAVRDAAVRDRVRNVFKSVPERYLKRLITGYPWRPEDFSKPLPSICKTHVPITCIPPQIINRVIFVFGDPKESAYSAYRENLTVGSNWLQRHQVNLMGQGEARNLFSKDILNFEGQLTAAVDRLAREKETTMLVHYADLWEMLPEISQFLELDVTLPEFRARKRSSDFDSIKWGQDFERLKHLSNTVRLSSAKS